MPNLDDTHPDGHCPRISIPIIPLVNMDGHPAIAIAMPNLDGEGYEIQRHPKGGHVAVPNFDVEGIQGIASSVFCTGSACQGSNWWRWSLWKWRGCGGGVHVKTWKLKAACSCIDLPARVSRSWKLCENSRICSSLPGSLLACKWHTRARFGLPYGVVGCFILFVADWALVSAVHVK